MQIIITTQHKRQVIDITEQLEQQLGGQSGLANIFIQHTTAAITTADLDPGTDQDFLDFLEAITPKLEWRHPHDPAHAPDHLLSSLIGTSVSLPVKDGQFQLGTWQRLILVELDGPRTRQIQLSIVKSDGL